MLLRRIRRPKAIQRSRIAEQPIIQDISFDFLGEWTKAYLRVFENREVLEDTYYSCSISSGQTINQQLLNNFCKTQKVKSFDERHINVRAISIDKACLNYSKCCSCPSIVSYEISFLQARARPSILAISLFKTTSSKAVPLGNKIKRWRAKKCQSETIGAV